MITQTAPVRLTRSWAAWRSRGCLPPRSDDIEYRQEDTKQTTATRVGILSCFHFCFPATRIMASRLRSISASVVAQDETLIRIAVCPCQTVPPHQQVPSV